MAGEQRMGEKAGESAVDIDTGKRSICTENTDSAPSLEQDAMVAAPKKKRKRDTLAEKEQKALGKGGKGDMGVPI